MPAPVEHLLCNTTMFNHFIPSFHPKRHEADKITTVLIGRGHQAWCHHDSWFSIYFLAVANGGYVGKCRVWKILPMSSVKGMNPSLWIALSVGVCVQMAPVKPQGREDGNGWHLGKLMCSLRLSQAPVFFLLFLGWGITSATFIRAVPGYAGIWRREHRWEEYQWCCFKKGLWDGRLLGPSSEYTVRCFI